MQTSEPFKNEHSLIIVSGRYLAKIFEYNNGKITPQPVIHVEPIKYTDNEGFRAPNYHSDVNSTPSSYESHNNGEWDYFIKEFKARTAELMAQDAFDAIYLFAPQEVMSQVKELLPKEWLEKLQFEHSGNFTKALPAELVDIITSEYEAKLAIERENDPANWTERAEEAKSILSIPKVSKGSV